MFSIIIVIVNCREQKKIQVDVSADRQKELWWGANSEHFVSKFKLNGFGDVLGFSWLVLSFDAKAFLF